LHQNKDLNEIYFFGLFKSFDIIKRVLLFPNFDINWKKCAFGDFDFLQHFSAPPFISQSWRHLMDKGV
jgi:hypothetical protein